MGGSISTRSQPSLHAPEVDEAPQRGAGAASSSDHGTPPPALGLRTPPMTQGGGPHAALGAGGDVVMGDASAASGSELQQRVIPTVFRWEHGGNNVYITGTFNAWGRKIPMYRSGNDFVYIHALTAGKHAYKFVVDDEWRFAPDQPRSTDIEGNINNTIDLTDFRPDDEGDTDDTVPLATGTAAAAAIKRRDSMSGVIVEGGHGGAPYGHALPDEEAYSKEPPLLPPHLRAIVLNQPSPDPSDPAQLPLPMHVTLNHLYCTAIRDGLMVQTITSRYRRKFFSTVFYSTSPDPRVAAPAR